MSSSPEVGVFLYDISLGKPRDKRGLVSDCYANTLVELGTYLVSRFLGDKFL